MWFVVQSHGLSCPYEEWKAAGVQSTLGISQEANWRIGAKSAKVPLHILCSICTAAHVRRLFRTLSIELKVCFTKVTSTI